MADRYWVGGNANWDTTAGTKWATTSGGAGGSAVPTAADDVFLDNGAGTGNVTISATAVCRSLNCTGYVGTLTHGPGNIALNIGDATAGASNVALLFVAGMTYTCSDPTSSSIGFVSTSATQQTIDFAGKTTARVSFSPASNGSWQYVGSHTTTGALTLNRGTLDLNGQTCTWGGFSSNNSNTRTLTLGSSSLTMTTASPWNVTVTNLTVPANTCTVTCTAAGASFITWQTFNWNGMSLVFTGGSANFGVSTNLTFANLTFTGTAVKTNALTLFGDITTTGAFTINGNSVTNRVLVNTNTIATTRTVTASTVSLSNVDFMDITGAGAASPFTGTSLGNALGNSGITFTTPVTRYGVVAGNWSNTATWSSTSGGGGGSSVPLCHDTVILDASSAAGTYTADMPRMGASVTCTGFTRTLSCTSTSNTIYGDWTLGSGMTLTSTQALVLAGRSSYTLTSAGKSFGSNVNFNSPGGTYTLQDALTLVGSSNTLQVNYGTFTANNFSVTTPVFVATGSSTINMGSGTWTVTFNQSAGFPWQMGVAVTVNASTSNVVIGTAAPYARTFSGGGKTYHTLTYTVANSPGSLTIYNVGGANTFNTINVGSGRILTMPSAITTTVTSNFNVNGAVHGYNYMPGITGNYMSTPDSAALDITGDITAVAKVNMPDWTPASSNTFLCKWNTTGNQRSYAFQINAAGRLEFYWSVAGAVLVGTTATASVPFTDGQTGYVAASLDVDNGASGYDLKFWTSTDGTTWTQLGTTIVGGATTSIFAGTALLEIGSLIGGTASLMTGKMIQAQVYDGLRDLNAATGGTLVFDANLATKTVGADTFTESSSNAATVTINGDIAKLGDGRVSIVSGTPGTASTISKTSGTVSCDYLTVQDSTAATTVPFYAGANSVNVSGNTNWTFTAPPSGSSKFMLMGVG